jgi:hypothetical protein
VELLTLSDDHTVPCAQSNLYTVIEKEEELLEPAMSSTMATESPMYASVSHLRANCDSPMSPMFSLLKLPASAAKGPAHMMNQEAGFRLTMSSTV